MRLVVSIIFLAAALLGGCTFEPVIKENVDSLEWLPPEASDISYYSRDGFGS